MRPPKGRQRPRSREGATGLAHEWPAGAGRRRRQYVHRRITALDASGNVLASFTELGVSTDAGDNSAIFIGIRSDSTPINELQFSLVAASSPLGDFAINELDFTPVPQPSSLALAGLRIVSLLAYGWRRRSLRA
jgi:hypothetical protein